MPRNAKMTNGLPHNAGGVAWPLLSSLSGFSAEASRLHNLIMGFGNPTPRIRTPEGVM